MTEADNGRTVYLRQGQSLAVVLHSTYWSFNGSSNSAVLDQTGVTASPDPHGPVPGSGAGTVTADFRAVADGTAEVSASRRSCGEAVACAPKDQNFRVTVVVRG